MPASVNQPPSPHRTPLVHRLSNVRVLGSAPTSWCAASTFFSQQSPSCSAHRSLLKHPTHTAQPSVASQLAEQAAASDCLLCGPHFTTAPSYSSAVLPAREHARAANACASPWAPAAAAGATDAAAKTAADRATTAAGYSTGSSCRAAARCRCCAPAPPARRTHTVQSAASEIAAAHAHASTRHRRAARAARAPSTPLIAPSLGGRALREKVRGRGAGGRRAQPAGATHSGPRTQRWRSPRLPTHVSIFCTKIRLPAAPS